MKRLTDEKSFLVVRDGYLHIEVAQCVHCEGVTLAPNEETCDCGEELHPVVKIIPLGVRTHSLRIGRETFSPTWDSGKV